MDAQTQKRLDQVHELLFQISKGNFNYRIQRSNNDDELEGLIALLNMTVEELQDSFLHQGYIAMHDSYMVNTQVLFLIDKTGSVSFINPNGCKHLQYGINELTGMSLYKLMSKNSIYVWNEALKEIRKKSTFEKNIKLYFRTKTGLKLPAYCCLIKFDNNRNGNVTTPNNLLLTFPLMTSNRDLIEKQLRKKIDKLLKRVSTMSNEDRKDPMFSNEDIQKIRAVGQHIENHPESTIPSLKKLAHQYGTNEYKLKRGFKYLFGMTVLQFVKENRLRKAHVLVKESKLTFKIIAQMMGFKQRNHFSREFKKRYSYSPRDLRAYKNVKNGSDPLK